MPKVYVHKRPPKPALFAVSKDDTFHTVNKKLVNFSSTKGVTNIKYILKYTATPFLKNEGVHYLKQIITNKLTCNMHLFPFFHIINSFSKSVLLNNNKSVVLNK